MHKVATGVEINSTFFLTSSAPHTKKWDFREHDRGLGPPNGHMTISSLQKSALNSKFSSLQEKTLVSSSETEEQGFGSGCRRHFNLQGTRRLACSEPQTILKLFFVQARFTLTQGK
jgi:hypothetical protein